MIQILGVSLTSTDYESASQELIRWARAGQSRFVCAANVHMLMEAYDSAPYKEIVHSADLVVPDGMPLVWMMRAKGQKRQQRVYGPTLMLHVLEAAAQEKLSVGFYGSRPEVLDALVKRMQAQYPALNAIFSCSPPFGELSPEQDAEIVKKIDRSGVQILFVGLGCPRQEIWMAAHRGIVQAVMIGVGAAFDFHAGLKSQAPGWMQAIGLEWLFRLATEPGRLWRRYLYHNPRFIFLAVADLLGLLR
ncbi:MAG: WecB/TagA/CpsF family glycosyltransferase [Chloroflexota bacterium]